jgi:alpha-tubulin suppressor-like RCC1 family protein
MVLIQCILDSGHGPHGLADWEPRLIRGLEGIQIKQVEVGEDHSMALSEHGDVYTWGRGLYGQVNVGHRLTARAHN